MKLMIDVLSELWRFICAEWKALLGGAEQTQLSTDMKSSELLTIPQVAASKPLVSPMAPAPTVKDTVAPETADIPVSTAVSNQIMYVAYPATPCHLRPAIVLDTIIGLFPYAAKVKAISQRADWIRVQTPDLEGWVERFALTANSDDVLPCLEPDTYYDAEHPETIKLRTYIDDEFSARMLRTPLLNCEYAWYRLQLDKQTFQWPIVRPRTAGRWSEILRTEPSVHISSVPLTGSVMEFTDKDGIAQLYYVTAVTPDESVYVSGIDGGREGVYQELTISHDVISSKKARFICKT